MILVVFPIATGVATLSSSLRSGLFSMSVALRIRKQESACQVP
jgi:hypothetical protein